MPDAVIDKLYQPNFTESSRQRFVAALKGYVNGPMERQLAELYSQKLAPEFEEQQGRFPENVDEATGALRRQTYIGFGVQWFIPPKTSFGRLLANLSIGCVRNMKPFRKI